MQNSSAKGGWVSRIKGWFPDREFFMRSEGQVRFITISSRVQMTAAGIAAAALLAWGGSMGAMSWMQWQASSDRASLLTREAKVADSEERLAAYSADMESVTKDLKARQDFLEAALSSLPEDIKTTTKVSDSTTEAAETIDKVSMAIPEAAELARIEARQLAFVEGLTRYADWRAGKAEKALRRLGLDPSSMIRSAERQAMGGPLETLTGAIDPRFERLGLSLARMNALEQGLDRVPQVKPASRAVISSNFGFRRDPFTRRSAMHNGLDFKGPRGAPIHAAAAGRVSFVGWKGGYGKTVEIQHGNGLMTRYAHMSNFNTKLGAQVSPGDLIGGIGSTGRSTGPHLHFEVRIHNKPVNPRTFLEQAPHVLEEIRRVPELARR